MSLFRQGAVTFLSRITVTLVNIPISMIIARTLGPEGQGIYSVAITFPNLWAAFGLFGLDGAHLYFLARDRRNLGPVVANSLLVLLALTAVLLPSYFLLVEPLIGESGAGFRPYLLLSAIVVPLILARLLFMTFFLGLGRVELYNGLLVLAQIGLLAMVAFGLLVANAGTGFVIVAYQISLVLMLVPSVFWLRRQIREEDRRKIHVSKDLLGRSAAYGLKGHLGIVLTHFSYRFDTVLVLRWLGVAAQGYYSIAVLLAEKLTHVTASMQFVLFPRIAASEKAEADRLTPLVCRNTIFWMAILGGLLFAGGRLMIHLFYGETYLPALGAFRVLLPGIVALSLSNILSSDFSGRNRRVLPTVAMAIGFAVNLGLNFLWIPRLGIVGAAWASTVSYSVQSAIMAGFFWRLTGISPLRLILPSPGDFVLYKRVGERLRRRLRGKAHEGEPGPRILP